MAFIKQLQQDGADIYPVTKVSAVYADDNKTSIDEYMKQNFGGHSVATTLEVANWTGQNAPYTYDIGSDYADKTVTVGFNSTLGTEDQLNEAQFASIQGGSGTLLYAWGDKPTKDIPIIIQYS